MLTQGGLWLILVLKTDLSSIQTTEQRPISSQSFNARCQDLHGGQALDLSETKPANGQEWTLTLDYSITICNNQRFN